MQKVVRTGVALSALLAWSIAVAQNNMQPMQVAATEEAATTTSAPAPSGAEVAPGTTGTVTLPGVGAVSTTAAVVGGGALIGAGLIIANEDDDPAATTTTR